MPPKDKAVHNAIKNKSYHKRYATPSGRLSILLTDAKSRAKKGGMDFDESVRLELTTIPETCPLCEGPIRLDKDTRKDSPSIDRIDSSRGYERGNVWMICRHCNTIKNDASLERFERMSRNWRREVDERAKCIQGADGARHDMDPGEEPVVQRSGSSRDRRSIDRPPDQD